MANNRKRTRGRRIQTIDVPLTIIKNGKVIANPHPKAGKQIQIRHGGL